MEDKWKFGFVPASIFFGSTEDVLKPLSRLGYKGVEWSIWEFETVEELKKLVELTKSYGMEVSNISSTQDLITLDDEMRRDIIDTIKEKIKAAGDAKIDIVNVFSGPALWDPNALRLGKDINEGKAWSIILDSFNEFIDVAEKHKVYVTVEAGYGMVCRDYYTTKELLESIKSKYLAVNMDPSHYNLYRNDVPWVVRRLGEKIKYVHMKDSVGKPGLGMEDFIFPLLGEGTINWKEFFEALRDINYSGFLSAELESPNYFRNILGGDPVKVAEICMEQLKKLSQL